jgi:rhodanese-related sulfurtransferase
MNKKVIKFGVFLFFYYVIFFPKASQAVIPPDFIFNIGVQIVQFFSIMAIAFTAIFGAFFQFFKTKFLLIKKRKIFLIVSLSLIIIFSLTTSYFYAIFRQDLEYQKWLDESNAHSLSQNIDINYDDIAGDNGALLGADENDQLDIDGDKNKSVDTSSAKFVSEIDVTGDYAKFISKYYENISNGKLEQAYAMSKKSVDFNTFRNWYIKTTKITLDKLVLIDEKKSSIELTLYEDDTFIRYGVLMTLEIKNTQPVRIEKSEVKILTQGEIENNKISIDESSMIQEYEFFNKNENKNIITTDEEFKNLIGGSQSDYFILDARENIEYENGYFPGSVHIRFADLKAGRWIEVPKDKFVFVFCWSGIRGKEVAEFLRTKKVVASYLEGGANGWVEFGGEWVGNIKFGEKYEDLRYQKVFNTDEIETQLLAGAFLVDTREPYKFKQDHITNSVNIPIMYTPTINMDFVFNQVPEKSNIITVCDGYVNCFDAKLTGVELERRGHNFLGRYNKPWEYEK